MRTPLVLLVLLLVLVGCAAPAVHAALAKKHGKHHHVSSTSTSTSTTTTTETPTTAAPQDDTFDISAIIGKIPIIGELDIIKIHLPMPAPSRKDDIGSSTSDSRADGDGLIVRPGPDGHGRPPLYPQPATTGAPEIPEIPDIPGIPGIPGMPDIPGIPEIPELPEIPEISEEPEKPEEPEAPETPEISDEPETPQVPEDTELPEKPAVPEISDTPGRPEEPESPELPEAPETPKVPVSPKLPEYPESPDSPDAPEPPETPESPQSPESPADPAPEDDIVVIPDVATFDAVFANHSRLRDNIRVFAFGGAYEIIVNRTSNSVDVVMIRALPQNTNKNGTRGPAEDSEGGLDSSQVSPPAAPAAAATAAERRVLMTMRAPSSIGRRYTEEWGRETGGRRSDGRGGDEDGNAEESEDEDENENDENAYENSDDVYENDEDDDDKNGENEGEDENEEETKAGDKDIQDNDAARDEDDGHATLPDGTTDAVFINGSSIFGPDPGVIRFNASGLFMMNISMADDFMTVIVTQIGSLLKGKGDKKFDLMTDLVLPMEEKLKELGKGKSDAHQAALGSTGQSGEAQQTEGDSDSGGGSWSVTTLLALLAACALATLGAAFLVSRSRSRARGGFFARRGDGYGSVDYAEEAIYFSSGF